MTKEIELVLEVHTDEDADVPSYIKAKIDEKFAQRILMLSKLVKEYSIAYVADWYHPDFFVEDYESNEEGALKEWDGRADCCRVKIDDWNVQWTCYIKNTNISFYSDNCPLEIFQVMTAPFEDLALFTDLTSDKAKTALKERLEKGE